MDLVTALEASRQAIAARVAAGEPQDDPAAHTSSAQATAFYDLIPNPVEPGTGTQFTLASHQLEGSQVVYVRIQGDDEVAVTRYPATVGTAQDGEHFHTEAIGAVEETDDQAILRTVQRLIGSDLASVFAYLDWMPGSPAEVREAAQAAAPGATANAVEGAATPKAPSRKAAAAPVEPAALVEPTGPEPEPSASEQAATASPAAPVAMGIGDGAEGGSGPS